MKKILAFLLSIVLIFSVIPSFLTVNAEEITPDYTVAQWEVLEIELLSTAYYTNPYLEAEISATFTHEGGTVITLPGFIKDGNSIWAVRFTPTKTGLWTYSITCTDISNTGLFSSGTILAEKSSNKTALSTHGFIKHSDDNRHFVYDDGTPFFWLGDTQWQAPNFLNSQKCNYPGCTCGNQIRHEIDNRKAKGFTVFQTYFSSGSTKGIWEALGTKPSYTDFNNRIDEIFSYAYASDMVLVIGFGLHSATPQAISEKYLNRFVKYIVARYACYSVVWMSGQEITNTSDSKTTGKTCMEVFMSASQTASDFDGYNHPSGAHMYPMISIDSRAKALDESDWHNVWILQKGHGGTVGSKGFYSSYYNNPSGTVKPIIEGEANYEDINCGGFTGYNASRMCAWKALVCGCAGFTYGASGVWIDAYSLSSNACYGATNSYSYDLWYTGINKPGSFEMTYLRRFFENLSSWQSLVPRYADRTYADFNSCDEKSIASTEDARTAVCYFYNNDTTTGTVKKLDNTLLYDVYWYNTLTGKYIQIENNKNFASGTYTVPNKPNNSDWVLLITADNLKNTYIEETPFEDLGTGEIVGERITPISVSALGGVYTKKDNTNVDCTLALFDNNIQTVWTPLNQRTSQTFFCDLGSAQNLTNIVITPKAGTILPRLRVYASNDEENWTILVDNNLRENNVDGENNVSEKLSGCFRYLRIVLLSNTTLLSPAEVSEATYETMYNDHTKDYYSVTEIADISLYSKGSGTPTADKKVTPSTSAKPTVSPSSVVPTESPKPSQYITLTNGNCENGTVDGWGPFSGGSVANVSGGANGSSRAIKYIPASSKYGSVGYDLGPYIVNDRENGYNGYGAGTYKVSFWIKSATNDVGKFGILLNSDYHLTNAMVRKFGDEYAGYTMGTFFGISDTFEITTQWQKVECTIAVPQQYINMIKQIYRDDSACTFESSSSTKFNTDIYTLWLRLDGSGTGRAYENGTFPYLIDDVSITCVSAEEDKKGVLLTLKDTTKGAYTMTTSGYLNSVAVENGTITKKITVYNTSDKELTVSASIQAETKNTVKNTTVWAGPTTASGGSKKIPAGGSATYNLSLTVENGLIQIPNCESKATAKFFLRFDVVGAGQGNTIIVTDNDMPNSLSNKFSYGTESAKYVYSLPHDGTLLGDCNEDGLLTLADRIIFSRFVAGWENNLYVKYGVSDINRDGSVNSADRIILSRYLAGWQGYEEYFK